MFINCLIFFDLSAIFECLMVILQMQLFIYMFLFIIIDSLLIYMYNIILQHIIAPPKVII